MWKRDSFFDGINKINIESIPYQNSDEKEKKKIEKKVFYFHTNKESKKAGQVILLFLHLLHYYPKLGKTK